MQIDYIASKGAVRVEPHSAGTILGFETMVDVDDHIPVYVTLCLLPSHKRMLLSRRSTPYNRKALLLPANVAKLQWEIGQLPLQHFDLEPTTHAAVIDQQLMDIAISVAPPSAAKYNKSQWMSANTFELLTRKSHYRWYYRRCGQRLRQELMRHAFIALEQAWNPCYRSDVQLYITRPVQRTWLHRRAKAVNFSCTLWTTFQGW